MTLSAVSAWLRYVPGVRGCCSLPSCGSRLTPCAVQCEVSHFEGPEFHIEFVDSKEQYQLLRYVCMSCVGVPCAVSSISSRVSMTSIKAKDEEGAIEWVMGLKKRAEYFARRSKIEAEEADRRRRKEEEEAERRRHREDEERRRIEAEEAEWQRKKDEGSQRAA